MDAESKIKHARIPIQIENIEKLNNASVVNPENSIIVLGRAVWIIVEQISKFLSPMNGVQL